MTIPKMVLCVGHPVLRLTPIKKPGVVIQGNPKFLIEGKPISLLYYWTNAGKILTVNNKVWLDGRPVGVAPGKCTEGISLKGSPKVILG